MKTPTFAIVITKRKEVLPGTKNDYPRRPKKMAMPLVKTAMPFQKMAMPFRKMAMPF